MPMTREQAEFAFENNPKLRRLGGNREVAIQRLMRMNPEEVASNVPAGAPIGRPATRQTAISAAMGGPEPKMVTPAAPAPMRPGIPIMAPRPEARQLMPADVRQMAAREEAGMPQPAAVEAPAPAPAPARAAPAAAKPGYVSPARIAAREAERELGMLNYNKKKMIDQGIPATAEIEMAIDLAERKLFSLQAEANAEESATIDADRERIFADQQKALDERRGRIASDEKGALSDALIKGGLALMNPQRGANFLSALSGGLGQGLEAYDAVKAKAVEERARLGADTNALALQKIDALTQARSAAVGAIRRGDEVSERTLRIANLTDEAIVNQATQQAKIQTAAANARKAQTQADYEERKILSDLTYQDRAGAAALMRGENSGDGGSGGPKRVTATANSDIKGLEKAENEAVKLMTDARRAWIAAGRPGSGEEVTAMRDANTALQTAMEARRGYLERLGLPYTEKNIPAKKAYRQEFGLEPKPKSKPRSTSKGGLPADVAAKYGL
jgi:hypothetical protein